MKRTVLRIIILITILFVARVIFHIYQKWHHQLYEANMEKNRDVMKYFVNSDEAYILLAFDKLESAFKDPNSFKLDAFSVHKKDTILNTLTDTIYSVYFTYHLENDDFDTYFSKVSVLKDTAKVMIYNLDIKSSEEYRRVQAEKNSVELQTMKSVRESLKALPDSTRKRIRDSIEKLK